VAFIDAPVHGELERFCLSCGAQAGRLTLYVHVVSLNSKT
jgi:hypothetical protein